MSLSQRRNSISKEPYKCDFQDKVCRITIIIKFALKIFGKKCEYKILLL